MKKIKITGLFLVCLLFFQAMQAQNTRKVFGHVIDETDAPLPGVTIILKNSTRGVITDLDGKYSIDDVSSGDVLVFSFLGMATQEIAIGAGNEYPVKLLPKVNEFEEVTVVAFAKQKKESVISSIATVNPQELKVPASNLTTALAGRVAGLIAFQQSGEPGNDNAQFFVRGVTTFGYKKDPLILIDNIELTSTDLARLNVDDIAQFSIMKDATATALYGARGANGVIIVTTKQGMSGKPKISVRAEYSVSQPVKMVAMADPITFMQLNNEAVNTRLDPLNPTESARYTLYSQEKIDNTIAGTNPYVYPAVDWYNELFHNEANTYRVNMNISGGGTSVRYYIAASYAKDNGVLKNDHLNNYNSNIDLKKYTVRSNINIDLTKTTEAIIRVNGSFDDYVGPLNGGDQLFNKVMRTSPVLYPKAYPATGIYANSTHVLFGNSSLGNYLNPYADMVKGYKEYNRTMIVAQAELKQKFDFLTKGLELRGMLNTTRYSYNDVLRYSVPYHYEVEDGSFDKTTGAYTLKPVNLDGSEHLDYYPQDKSIETTNYIEVAGSYDRTFAKHAVSAMLVYTRREQKISNADNLPNSLPHRNQGISGRLTYAFDSKYFTEFNFGYNGSERFAKNERYGFFPSVGAGYIISNESFWEPLSRTVDKLKFKATYGLVGNDAIGDQRFLYLSVVNPSDDSRGQFFGTTYTNHMNGVSNSHYGNPFITWEKSKKTNGGIELGMFNSALELQADIFYEYRSNIYQERPYIPSSMGLSSGIHANLGEASSRGIDLSFNYSYISPRNYWAKAMANFTYATSRYEKYEEMNFAGFREPWRSRIGQPINYNYGYIAERLFIDENDIANSPMQTFGNAVAQPGDIKYKDLNKDGKISESDQIFMGYPNQPEITYGFGFSAGYKNFDLSMFFQGNARVSVFLSPDKITPFVDISTEEKGNIGMDGNKTAVTNLMALIANDHWSEENRNLYAFWPRLAPSIVHNNTQQSTWWLYDASFMRLKTVELGYTLSNKWTKAAGIQSFRVYVTGNNLLSFTKFKLWDPEMGNNGLGYPIQKIYNIGINFNF